MKQDVPTQGETASSEWNPRASWLFTVLRLKVCTYTKRPAPGWLLLTVAISR